MVVVPTMQGRQICTQHVSSPIRTNAMPSVMETVFRFAEPPTNQSSLPPSADGRAATGVGRAREGSVAGVKTMGNWATYVTSLCLQDIRGPDCIHTVSIS